jgi:hypothetical protein
LPFAATLILTQKIRFWKAVALLVAVCVAYTIYLNIAVFQLKSSSQPSSVHRQQKPGSDADSSPKPQAPSESSQNPQQKMQNEAQPSSKQQQNPPSVRASESPEKLKAIILKSIPHDTGAFTQVLKKAYRAHSSNFD